MEHWESIFIREKQAMILLARPELSVSCVKHNLKEEYPRGTNLNGRENEENIPFKMLPEGKILMQSDV